MGFSFIPREEKFFDMFDEAVGLIVKGSDRFHEMVIEFDNLEERAKEIKDLEHSADLVTERIYVALDRTFLTPIEPEDIHRLAGALDDILDHTEETSHRLWSFRIEKPTASFVEMARLLKESCKNVAKAVNLIRTMKQLDEIAICLREIGVLENKADEVFRKSEASLFVDPIPPIEVIKWKDLYEHLEGSIDATRDAANVLSEIVLKSS